MLQDSCQMKMLLTMNPGRATRSEKILHDGIVDSDDSDMDFYRPEEEDCMQDDSRDDIESEDEVGTEIEVEKEDKAESGKEVLVASKKGKKAKKANLDDMTLKAFDPLSPPLDLNPLLNSRSVASGAQGKFHGIYASRLALILPPESVAFSL